jgi:tetratricopeptide (TPR) repeat protein
LTELTATRSGGSISSDALTLHATLFFRRALLGIAIGGVVAQVAASAFLTDRLWGLHLYAFLPAPLGVIAWAGTLLTAVWLARPVGSEPVVRLACRVGTFVEAHPAVTVIALAAGAGGTYWLFRSRQLLLGDALPLVQNLPAGESFHHREPLTMHIQQALYRLTGGSPVTGAAEGLELAQRSVAIGSVAGGVLFVFVAFALGWALAGRGYDPPPAPGERGGVALLTALIFLSQGYCALFFGYLENYTFVALFVGLYVLSALNTLDGRWPLAVSIAVFLVAFALHLQAIVLVPSLVVLIVAQWRAQRRAATLRDLALGAAGTLVLDLWLRSTGPDWSLGAAVGFILHTGGASEIGDALWLYMFSLRHLRDFLNVQYLIGPLSAFLFVPAAWFVLTRLGRPSARLVFLFLAGAVPLAMNWALPDPTLGYARDWDLFAPSGVALVVTGISILLHCVRSGPDRIRLLGLAWIVSALHLAPWALVNASEARSLARFKQLPLGEGRTEVVVGNWYRRHGREEEAIDWLERAIRINPNQNNAYALLGELHFDRGQTAQAVELHTKALKLRPKKPEYRRALVKALLAEHRFEETLPHSEWLCVEHPEVIHHWLAWNQALFELGHEGEAQAVMRRALDVFLELRDDAPHDAQANLHVGILYAGLDEKENAFEAFERSLEAQPGSRLALFNAASMLMGLDRAEEARPYLEQLLALDLPEPTRAQVQRWLIESDED